MQPLRHDYVTQGKQNSSVSQHSKGFFKFLAVKSNRPFSPRFTCDFQISHVICQIHLPYTGHVCPERLLRKSSNEKRSEICILEQFVTRMVRYGGKIKNGKGKYANVGLFWNAFSVTL